MCTVVSETLFYSAEEARRQGLWMVNWDDDVFGMAEGVSFLNELIPVVEPAPISISINDGAAAAVVDGAETRVVGALPPVKTG